MPKTSVIVMAHWDRREAQERLFDSLEASDVGQNFRLKVHPADKPAREHWRAVHLAAADSPTDLVVVLEDDAIVNRHLLHNVNTWKWTGDNAFGAGWLFNAGGYASRDTWYLGPHAWYGTVGVVYHARHLPELVELAYPLIEAGTPWDQAMSLAIHRKRWRIRVHYPSLVEHPDDLPSVVGNPPNPMRTSRGSFRLDWRRPFSDVNGSDSYRFPGRDR
jgi:hypothetical protein